jgi:hypothetical protein
MPSRGPGREETIKSFDIALATGLLLCSALAPGLAMAATEQPNPDWVCVQRLIPEIESGMIWAGPPLDRVTGNWQTDPDVAALAATLASRSTPMADAERKIADLAARLPADQRQQKLTLLFKGTLEILNGRRRGVIAGIERYGHGQRALAERIEGENKQINDASEPADAGAQASADPLVAQRDWDLRVFNDRRKMLQQICDEPTAIDQRAFAIARAIQSHLETP